MNLDLTDKVAFVTGASSGIGAAVAKILAEEGADVVISYHQDAAGAGQTADAVRACGRRAWLCRMDIRDPRGINTAVEALPAEAARLDLLIVCSGRNIVTPFAEISAQEWEEVMQVNLNGPFYVIQALAPRLREGSSIVTVASVAAHTGAPHHPHYAAAKAGLVNLTKSTARALAPRVRVNCVAPGITLTPMGQETASTLAPDYAQKRLLTQRFASPEEIARCIVFVGSPAAAFMSGATIDINGGRDLR
jgi:3-oxoacyl-[acyl-carrier protein] reductase